jgi:LysR family carnitine catabolism transcriptional activator
MVHELPNLSVKHLRAIIALARFGSFVAASAYLHISQPGLTRIIQQVEALLQATLFVRTRKNVVQTAAGREFVPVAERLLGELMQQAQKIRNLDGQMRGQLIIAGLTSVCRFVLPAALVAYRKQHPKMHIQIREGVGTQVHEDVRSGIADFGIGNAIGLHEAITVENVSKESCYVVLPRQHPLSKKAFVKLADLVEEQVISMPPDSGLRRTIDVMAASQNATLNYTMILHQYTSMFDFIESGLGVSIVPASVLPAASKKTLVAKPLRPAIVRQIGILYLAERPLSPASKLFLDIFRPMFIGAVSRHKV